MLKVFFQRAATVNEMMDGVMCVNCSSCHESSINSVSTSWLCSSGEQQTGKVEKLENHLWIPSVTLSPQRLWKADRNVGLICSSGTEEGTIVSLLTNEQLYQNPKVLQEIVKITFLLLQQAPPPRVVSLLEGYLETRQQFPERS